MQEFLSLSSSPNWPWHPPNLPSDWYWGIFARRWNGRTVKIIRHIRLVPSLCLVLYLHGIVL